ncbi:MAG: DUF4199 domain-containing protein [Chlorobium sp.]|nr:MAG: DUF4199 domain-containing protein [Chlorobium sp.]
MAAEKPVQSLLPVEGKLYAVLLGTAMILFTTTVPYLTLLNVFLFAGIFLAGVVALHQTIMRFQVTLTFREAFVLGCMAGLAGGVVSEVITFFLMTFLHYRPGTESLALIVDWALEMARKQPELQEQVQALVAAEKLALAPVTLTFTELLMNMAFSGIFYAPIAGLGGAYAVRRLKRQASRG